MAGVGEPPPPGEWPEVRTDGLAPAPDPVHPEEGTVEFPTGVKRLPRP